MIGLGLQRPCVTNPNLYSMIQGFIPSKHAMCTHHHLKPLKHDIKPSKDDVFPLLGKMFGMQGIGHVSKVSSMPP
jgi:hypothetical protein